eukprot:4277532-Prymnesium_polylepis.1
MARAARADVRPRPHTFLQRTRASWNGQSSERVSLSCLASPFSGGTPGRRCGAHLGGHHAAPCALRLGGGARWISQRAADRIVVTDSRLLSHRTPRRRGTGQCTHEILAIADGQLTQQTGRWPQGGGPALARA